MGTRHRAVRVSSQRHAERRGQGGHHSESGSREPAPSVAAPGPHEVPGRAGCLHQRVDGPAHVEHSCPTADCWPPDWAHPNGDRGGGGQGKGSEGQGKEGRQDGARQQSGKKDSNQYRCCVRNKLGHIAEHCWHKDAKGKGKYGKGKDKGKRRERKGVAEVATEQAETQPSSSASWQPSSEPINGAIALVAPDLSTLPPVPDDDDDDDLEENAELAELTSSCAAYVPGNRRVAGRGEPGLHGGCM